MKKTLLTILFATGLFYFASAQTDQKKYKIGIGPDFLYVMGATSEFYTEGYGGSIQGEYKLSPKLNATLSGGVIMLKLNQLYKEIYEPWKVEFKNGMFYPVKAGFKYDLTKSFYASADAGAIVSSDTKSRATSFGYAGGIGTRLPVSTTSGLDVGIRYEAWSVSVNDTYSFIGLRAAYVFGF